MHNRRSVISSGLALMALGASLRSAHAQRAGAPAEGSHGAMTLQECIEACLKSHAMCLETARYCMGQGSSHVSVPHLALLLDCAEICQTTANSLLRRSPQHRVVCDACARLCEACALDCEMFPQDAQMQLCARTCRDCAQSCRDMATMPL